MDPISHQVQIETVAPSISMIVAGNLALEMAM